MSKSVSMRLGGFALASAIFLLVILAALGAYILNVSSSQQLGMAIDISGERAWQAADAGMEWVRYKLASNPGSPSCPATTSFGFPGTSTLADFYVTVECTQLTVAPAADVLSTPTWVFEVKATACSPANAGQCPGTPTALSYAERQLQGLISF